MVQPTFGDYAIERFIGGEISLTEAFAISKVFSPINPLLRRCKKMVETTIIDFRTGDTEFEKEIEEFDSYL